MWTYDQLDWFSLIIIISNNSQLQKPHEKEKVDFILGCRFAFFRLSFLAP
jgi:hypothetical protein